MMATGHDETAGLVRATVNIVVFCALAYAAYRGGLLVWAWWGH